MSIVLMCLWAAIITITIGLLQRRVRDHQEAITTLESRTQHLESECTIHQVMIDDHARKHEGFAKRRAPRALKAVTDDDSEPDGAA